MPELPEVELARRSLERWFRGHRLLRVEADPKVRTLRGADVKALRALRGRLVKADRKGKYLLLSFEGGGLVGHLGMTGKLVRRAAGVDEPYSRARFVLDDGTVIHFRDPRLFGRLEPAPVEHLMDVAAVAALGVDPVRDGLDVLSLKAALLGSRQALKVALMDQTRVTGLGNIHAAEALYRAGLHPARKVASLTDEEWRRLCDGIHATIAFALDAEAGEEIEYVEEKGAPNPFLVYAKKGERCPRCGQTFASLPMGGRTTWYCPGCQPKRGGPSRRRKSSKETRR